MPTRPWIAPGLLFFASGSAGLVYQVVWMRHAALQLGATGAAVGTVVATFLGGLAIGSSLGGRLADRLAERGGSEPLLRLYGVLELGIAAYALAFATLLGLASSGLGGLYAASGEGGAAFLLARVGLAAGLILPPTIAMGATLPLLARHAAAVASDSAAATGRLYSLNTLGAVVGAAAAGFWLVPDLGLAGATRSAAGVSALVGLVALGLSRRAGAAAGPPTPDAPPAGPVQPPAPAWVLPAYAISGFAALVCEVAWTRGLILALGSSVQAFSLVLTAFILGLGVGGGLGTWLAARARDAFRVFAGLQVGVAVLVAATVLALERLPIMMMKVVADASGYGSLLVVQGLLAVLVVALPALLMGAQFPVLCRVVLGTAGSVGAAVGRLYAWNAAGNILGALAGAFLLIPWQGVPGALRFAAGLNILVAAWVLARRRQGQPSAGPPLVLAGGVAMLVLLPGWDLALVATTPMVYGARFATQSAQSGRPIEETLRGANRVLFARWDHVGLVTVHEIEGLLTLRTNGKAEASNRDDVLTQVLTAHLPLVLHPRPQSALVIGLGSGGTVAAALRHPLASAHVVELSPAIIEASRAFESSFGPWREDPRLRVYLGDARTHVRHTRHRYDVIAAEPSNLWVSGMATLFTREQFQRYRALLNPGGIVCQWVHAYRLPAADFASVLGTFREVFPGATLWEVSIAGDYLLVGSTEPLPDFATVRSRFEIPDVIKELKRAGIPSAEALLHQWIAGPAEIGELARRGRPITDDDCHVEHSSPRGLVTEDRAGILEALSTVRARPAAGLPGGPPLGPMRAGRALLADAVLAAQREGSREAFARLAVAVEKDAGDPALPAIVNVLSLRALEHARFARGRGDLALARELLSLVPKESPAYAQAQRELSEAR